jgi:hypothetical protein
MIVNRELKTIADSYGMLSPELSVGYRAALAARNEFESLDDVCALVFNANGAGHAIGKLVQRSRIEDFGEPIYSFFHTITGSILLLESIPALYSLPPCCIAIENEIIAGRPVDAARLHTYQNMVDTTIATALSSPEKELFSIRRYRCRPLSTLPAELCLLASCEICNAHVMISRLYDCEGKRLCVRCARVDPAWFGNSSVREYAARARHV